MHLLSDILHRTGAIRTGSFSLPSGEFSPIYFDLTKLISFPREFDIMTDRLSDYVKNLNPDKIAGAASSGIPFASAISLKTNIPMLYVRREQKSFGTQTQIEGHLVKGEKVLLIDDVLYDGISTLDFIRGLKQAGADIENVLVMLDRQQGGINKLEREGIKVTTLLTATGVLSALHKAKRIDTQTYEEILGYWKR